MNRIKQLLNFITPQHDKLKHFWLGFVITFLSFIVYTQIKNINVILLPSLVIGFSIEVYQTATKTGKLEFLDLFYTVLPSIFLSLVIWVL